MIRNALHRLWKRPQRRRYTRDRLIESPYDSLEIARLEERCVLDASFTSTAGNLVLDTFTDSASVTIRSDNNEIFFDLASGTWSGTEDPGKLTGNGSSTLSVTKNSLNAVALTTTQANAVAFEGVDFGSRPVELTGVGAVTQTAAISIDNFAVSGASVNLLNSTNDFGTLSLIVSGNASLADTAGVNFQSSSVGGSLTLAVTSGDITQAGVVTVGADSDLTANNIDLDDFNNLFDGELHLNVPVAGDVAIRNASSTATLDGLTPMHDLILEHTATNVSIGALTAGGSVTITALGDITQTAGNPWLISGDATLQATGNITLSNSNDIAGLTTFVTASTSDVEFTNIAATTLFGIMPDMQDLTLNTPNSSLSLGGLAAHQLTLDALGVSQTGAWVVGGGATITVTGNIDLSDSLNDLAGSVTIQGASTSDVDVSNSHVGTSYSFSPLHALTLANTVAGVTLDGLTLADSLFVSSASTITQTGVWNVAGATTLVATGDVVIDNANNQLDGNVSVATSGAVVIHNDSVTASLAVVTTVGSLDVVHEQAGISLDGVAVTGDMSLNATGTISQTGTWNVSGNVSLTATSDITVGDVNNQFEGTVDLSTPASTFLANKSASATVGDVSPMTNLTVVHSAAPIALGAIDLAGQLILQSFGTISQTGVWHVAGATTMDVTGSDSDINLDGIGNLFGDQVSINSSSGSLRDVELRNDVLSGTLATFAVSTSTPARDVTIQASNTNVALGAITATGSLSVTANGGITQTAAVHVDGATTVALVSVGAIDLSPHDNQFSTIAVTVLDGTDFALRNVAVASAFPSVTGQLHNLVLEFPHSQVELPGISLTGNLHVTSGADIAQTGIVMVSGLTSFASLTGSDILLSGQSNQFAGVITITGTPRDVFLRNEDPTPEFPVLPISVRDFTLVQTAGGMAIPSTSVLGSLVLQTHGPITQFGEIHAGSTNLTVSSANADVTLLDVNNTLGTTITVSTTGAGSVRDVRIRDIGAGSLTLNLPSQLDDLELNFLRPLELPEITMTGSLTVTSTQLTQSGAINVDGATTLNGVATSDVMLGSAPNELRGGVTIGGSVRDVAIRNASLLASAPVLPVGVRGFTLTHDATDVDLPSFDITGDLSITSEGSITQAGLWTVGGTSSLHVTAAASDVQLHAFANTLGATQVSAALDGSLRDVEISNHSAGTIAIDVSSTVEDVLLVIPSAASVELATLVATGGLVIQSGGRIEQTGPWTVTGTTILESATDIVVSDSGNGFGGTVLVDTSASASITNDSVTASVAIAQSMASLTLVHSATGIALPSLTVSSLSLDAAGTISQSGIWTVSGAATFQATGNIEVATHDNVLSGGVTLSTTGAASLKNTSSTASVTIASPLVDLSIEHTAASIAIGAFNASGAVTLNSATTITQSGVWTVSGATNLQATGVINIGSQNNVLAGGVSIQTPSAASLKNTSVTATVTLPATLVDATIWHTATGITLSNLSLTGNLELDAGGTIAQTGSWAIAGNATFAAGGNIILENQDNTWDGTVSVATPASASLRNKSVNATIDSLSSLTNLTIVHSHTGVDLGSINAAGDLVIDVLGDISQSAAWSVTGTTGLTTGGNIILGADNVLAGAVSITGTINSDVTLRNLSGAASIGTLTPLDQLAIEHANAGITLGAIDANSLSLTAAGTIAQSGAWNTIAATYFEASGDIQLGLFANDFAGSLDVVGGVTSHVAIRNVSTSATLDSIAAPIASLIVIHDASAVALGAITLTGDLAIESASAISQLGNWIVAGNTTLVSQGPVDLLTGSLANSLDGTLSIDSAGGVISVRNTSGTASIDVIASPVDALTVVHTQAGVSLGTVDVANDLSIFSGADITQTGEWRVGGGTSLTMVGSGSIALATHANDLPAISLSTSSFLLDFRLQNVNGGAVLPMLPASVRDLEVLFSASPILLPGMTVQGDMSLQSHGAISQGASIDVLGTTSLTVTATGSDVLLGSAANQFVGAVAISSAAGGTIRDVIIVNDVASVTSPLVTFGVLDTIRDLNLVLSQTDVVVGEIRASGNITISAAASISQTSAWVATGPTSLSVLALGTIDIGSFANELSSTVSFSAPAGSDLAYRNAVATAVSPVLPASLHDLDVHFDQAPITLPTIVLTGDLALSSGGTIAQTGTWTVAGTTEFELTAAGDIALGTQANDFSGTVTLAANPGPVHSLHFRNVNSGATLFGLPSSVDDLSIVFDQAAVSLPLVAVSGTLHVESNGTITQTGAITTAGAATFSLSAGGDVLLASAANAFTVAPVFVGTIGHLALRNTLPAAQFPSVPLGVADLTLQFDTAAITIPQLSLSGNLSVTSGGTISQTGGVTIMGDATLTLLALGDIELADYGNLFDNGVAILGTVQDIHLRNDDLNPVVPTLPGSTRDLELIYLNSGVDLPALGILGDMTLLVGSHVSQSGAIAVASLSITATNSNTDVVLQHVANDLGTSITMGVSGLGAIRDVRLTNDGIGTATFVVPPQIHDLELDFANGVDLPSVQVNGQLIVTSTGLTQSGSLTVMGTTQLLGVGGADILLGSAANDFALGVNVSGSVRDVALRNANAAASVAALPVGIRDLTLIHDQATMTLPVTSITGSLDVMSHGTIGQTGTLTVAGSTVVQFTSPGDLNWAGFANDLTGPVSLAGNVPNVRFRNISSAATFPSLPSGMNSVLMEFNSAGATVPSLSLTDSFTLRTAGDITQAGPLLVDGPVTLHLFSVADIGLSNAANQLHGTVTLSGSLQDITYVNASTVARAPDVLSTARDVALVHSAANIELSALALSGTLKVDADGSITQAGMVSVAQDVELRVTGPNRDILLDTQPNVISGLVTVGAAGLGSLDEVSLNNELAGPVSLLVTSELRDLTWSSPLATTATIVSVDATGNLVVDTLGTIQQGGLWEVAGTTTLHSTTGDIDLATIANLLPHVVYSAAGSVMLSSAVDLDISGTSGAVDIVSEGAIVGSNLVTTNGAAIANFVTRHDAGRSISVTNATLAGGVSAASENAAGNAVAAGSILLSENGDLLIDTISTTADAQLTATGEIRDNNQLVINLRTGTALLQAVTGIGVGDAIDVTVGTLSATTQTGAILIDSLATGPVVVNLLDTNSGRVQLRQDGGHTLSVATAATRLGDLEISNRGADVTVQAVSAEHRVTVNTTGGAGEIMLGIITAPEVEIQSDQSINDLTAGTDTLIDIDADTVDLVANTGIGNLRRLELSSKTITAETATGDIVLSNSGDGDTQLDSLTTSLGDLSFQQTGGELLTIANASTANGTISLSNVAANLILTQVTAGGLGAVVAQTLGTSGDIVLEEIHAGTTIDLEAVGQINAVGAVAPPAHLTGNDVTLEAGTGIGTTHRLTISANEYSAQSDVGNITLSSAARSAIFAVADELWAGSGDMDVSHSGTPLIVNQLGTGIGDASVLNTGHSLTAVDLFVGSAGNGDLLLHTIGNAGATGIGLGNVRASGNVTIISPGSVGELGSDGANDVTANALFVETGQGFGVGDLVETSVNSATIQGGAGVVAFQNDRPLTIGSSGTGGPGIVTTRDIRVTAPSILVAGNVSTVGNSEVALTATSGLLDIARPVTILTGSGGQFTGSSQGGIRVGGDGFIQTQTGLVAAIPTPLIATPVNQGGSTVTATGNAKIDVLLDDASVNYAIDVNWNDGTIDQLGSETDPVVGGTTYRFEHDYITNPNLSNSAATILALVEVAYDFRGALPNGIQFLADGVTLVASAIVELEPPGQGIAPALSVIAVEDVPPAVSRVEIVVDVARPIESTGLTQSGDAARGSSTSVAAPEKQLVLRAVAPSGAEGDDIELAMDELDDLTSLYKRLPDNRYRIYVIMEDGNARLILDVAIQQGSPIDPAATADEQPERPPLAASEAAETVETVETVEGATGETTASDVPNQLVPTIATPPVIDLTRLAGADIGISAAPANQETDMVLGADHTIDENATLSAAKGPTTEGTTTEAMGEGGAMVGWEANLPVAGVLLSGSALVWHNKRVRALRRALHGDPPENLSFQRKARRSRTFQTLPSDEPHGRCGEITTYP